MEQRTAIVIGATGLVGHELVQQLLQDQRFVRVVVLGRRNSGFVHARLEEHLISFDQPEQWRHLVKGDVLFSALGTTLKAAGSKEAQYKVDHTYQLEVAKAAAANGVPVYVLVSSAMAHPDARLFYTRMKGELERDVANLPFQFLHILQPGILTGPRKENRPGEKAGIALIRFLNKLGWLKQQRPVPASTVARALINVCFKKEKRISRYTLLQVFKEAE